MGCGNTNSGVRQGWEPKSIDLNDSGDHCIFCGSHIDLFYTLECKCFTCKSCVLKHFESTINYGKTSLKSFSCPKCKKTVRIKKMILHCGCVSDPIEISDNSDNCLSPTPMKLTEKSKFFLLKYARFSISILFERT